MRANGTLERYKARLVARGDKQKFGVDCNLTFSAVMPIRNAFVIFTFSRMWGIPARHGDVPSAYPKAFTDPEYESHLRILDGMKVTQDTLARLGVTEPDVLVLFLGRSLYGLKQAGRLCRQSLCDTLPKIDFLRIINDPCIFTRLTWMV